jgi:hypothetical protein
MIRSYRDLRRLNTLEERFAYLSLKGVIGDSTFGFDRWMNQEFYRSKQWRNLRHHILIRDNGCDLGIEGYEIHERPVIHHMNPMTTEDLIRGSEHIVESDYLITTSHRTHNAIHYGDASLLPQPIVERRRGDTKLW